jgi:hypothetical protein
MAANGFHRSALGDGGRDLTEQAIAAGVPVSLIDNEEGSPTRI